MDTNLTSDQLNVNKAQGLYLLAIGIGIAAATGVLHLSRRKEMAAYILLGGSIILVGIGSHKINQANKIIEINKKP